jgi:hypothetical protein
MQNQYTFSHTEIQDMRFSQLLLAVMVTALAAFLLASTVSAKELWIVDSTGTLLERQDVPDNFTAEDVTVRAKTGCIIDRSQNLDIPPTLTPPPAFQSPEPVIVQVEPPAVSEPASDDKPSVVKIVLVALSAAVGWYFGKNYADEDGEDDSLIDGAQRRMLERLLPVMEQKSTG